jgi:hypothetical protein
LRRSSFLKEPVFLEGTDGTYETVRYRLTPTFLIQDFWGRYTESLSDTFLQMTFAQLKFSKGIVFFEKERQEEATKWFRRSLKSIPTQEWLRSDFFLGVAEYKDSRGKCAAPGIRHTFGKISSERMGAPGSAIFNDTEVNELLYFLNICLRNFFSSFQDFLSASLL